MSQDARPSSEGHGSVGALPVFVLGTGRCGSTLVHEVLARHERTGFVTNLDDLGLSLSSRRQNDLWRRLPASVTKKGGARFAPSEAYRVVSKEVSPALVDPIRDLGAADATPWLAKRMRSFVERRVPRLDAPVFLHKFTGWPRSGFLQECFPDAVFIEVVRDGRGVANSWLQMDWWHGHRGPTEWHFGPLAPEDQERWEESGRSFPVLAALGWRILVDSFEEARTQVPAERWLTVRYEDVVASPRELLEQMLAHMGLSWSPRFGAGFDRYDFGSGRTEAFRRDLAPADLEAMEKVIGPALARHSYL